MFFKIAIAILALSPSAFCVAAPRECATTTMTLPPSTTTATATVTATPGPIIEVISYPETLCGVPQVSKNGNTPNFQLLELIYNPSTRNTNCARINENPLSFSWNIVSSLAPPLSSCNLYFYTGDSCFNDNGGSTQLSVFAANACHNLRGRRSVRMFC